MRYLVPFAIALTPLMLNAWWGKTSQLENKQESAKPAVEESLCHSPFHRTHVDIRHTESKGVGYKDGYSTLEWFGICDRNSYFMPFLDLRGHVFNDGKLAGNIGLGERTIIPSINHAFGLYVYYDIRQENHGLTVNQISPGFEFLGRRMEYRMNGYFPVGRTESHSYGHDFDKFKGHRIYIHRKKRFALTGGDAEVGVHITQSTRHDVYAGAGPYYFTADPFSSWGGKARLLWRYKEYISLEASYSYDKLFQNVFQGTLGLSYPLGKKLKRKMNNCSPMNDLTLSRTAFAPYRFEIPVVKKHHHNKIANNPATGQPWNVWFVNNLSNSLGTFESPFPTLLQAQNASGPNDIIYVFSGDGTSKGMDQGIVLQNAQKLFGAGIAQTIPTTVGSLKIPAMSPQLPTLINPVLNSSVVTLANGNEVAGFNILAGPLSSAPLIAGSIVSPLVGIGGINGASVHDNIFSGTVIYGGVDIFGYGTVFVFNNTFLDFAPPSFFGDEAVRLDVAQDNVMTAYVTNNTVLGFQTGVLGFLYPGSTGNFDISNNNISRTITQLALGTGILLESNSTPGKLLKARVSNNTMVMLSNPAITVGQIGSGTQQVCVEIENNTISEVQATNGIVILNPLAGSQINIRVDNNQILGVTGGFFGVQTSNIAGATTCLELSNNNAPAGYSLTNGAGGTFNLEPFVNNIGSLTTSGTITSVPLGTCACQ